MKTKTILLMVIVLFFLSGINGCNTSEYLPSRETPCDCSEKKVTITILKDAAASIQYSKLLETFVIELVNKKSVKYILIPCDETLPKKYKIKGLNIVVSGEVTYCTEWSKPEFRIIPHYNIKLSTIKNRQ